MNITDLIVEKLKQGKNVELPGIGMLKIELEEAHMDPTSGVFYPTRKTVKLTDQFEGDTSLLADICEKECVDNNVAQMMWKNYIDALTDKLNRTGAHELPNVGSLMLKDGKFQFQPLENINLSSDSEHTQPLQNVNIYAKDENDDPFAVFERPIVEMPTPEPEPVKEEPKVEEVVETPKAEEVKVDEPKVEEVVEEPKQIIEEPKPIIEEPKQEPKPVVETPKVEATKVETRNEATDSTSETLKQLNQIENNNAPKKEKKKKHTGLWILILLLLLLGAGGAYYYFNIFKANDANAEAVVEDSAAQSDELMDEALMDDEDATELDETEIEETETEVEESEEISEEEVVAEATEEVAEEAEEETAEEENEFAFPKNENIFTNNTDLLDYDQNDIFAIREQLCYQMKGYVKQYLADRGYKESLQPMMDRIRRYTDRRLEELLDNNTYSVRRFIPYDDYVYNYRYNELKQRKGNHARIQVQIELMQNGELKNLLNTMIDELGLRKGATAVKTVVKKEEPKPEPSAKIKSTSQKGFDIVAGFYTNRSSAIKMTNALKQQGCDAYIIDKQGLYYVSMGSASTQTAAEAMLKHIKTWYDGDAAIRKL